jgi:hypothetical protein
MPDHRDESGNPCTRHVPASDDALLALAAIGSRMPGFHHDCASKLQSLMMTVEELGEVAQTDDLRQVIEGAAQALRELNELFAHNRALAKAPAPRRALLSDLVRASAARAGVKLRGDAGAYEIETAAPALIHALAMVLDVVAGPGNLGRTVELTVSSDDHTVLLDVAGPPQASAKPAPNTSEILAIASFVVGREGGELRCINGGERFSVRLARAA